MYMLVCEKRIKYKKEKTVGKEKKMKIFSEKFQNNERKE